jgi:cyclopropane fatty-acyl-phospholipid synthase-like methyltransferase
MHLPQPEPGWPDSWRLSHQYDAREWGTDRRFAAYRYAYQLRMDTLLQRVRDRLHPPAHVLDVGAGQGTLSLLMAELGYSVTWNDYREDLIGYVQLKHETGTIRYLPGDVFSAPDAGLFDAVIAAEVIEHVAHPDDFLRKLRQFVHEEGIVVVSTPNGANFLNRLPSFDEIGDPSALEPEQFQPDSDGHLFLLLPAELHRVAANAGFRVTSLNYLQTHLAYALGALVPAALSSSRTVRMLRRADALLVRIPWFGRRLAVQMIAVLEPQDR